MGFPEICNSAGITELAVNLLVYSGGLFFVLYMQLVTLLHFYPVLQVKREELLQFAQGAMSGLKINYDLARSVRNKGFPLAFI